MYAHELGTHKTLCNSKHSSKEYKKAIDKCNKNYHKVFQINSKQPKEYWKI